MGHLSAFGGSHVQDSWTGLPIVPLGPQWSAKPGPSRVCTYHLLKGLPACDGSSFGQEDEGMVLAVYTVCP